MRRDMDLIRSLLIDIEGEDSVDLEEYTEEEIVEHKRLLIEAGLARGDMLTGADRILAIHIDGLTWEGHEFLSAARNKKLWDRARAKFGDELLSVPFAVLKAFLVDAAKEMF